MEHVIIFIEGDDERVGPEPEETIFHRSDYKIRPLEEPVSLLTRGVMLSWRSRALSCEVRNRSLPTSTLTSVKLQHPFLDY